MIEAHDLGILGLLIFLEGILSIDNALVLALLAAPLPQEKQKKALLYGMIGAFALRAIVVGLASYLIHMSWVKFAGGGYLLLLATKHFWTKLRHNESSAKPTVVRSFWLTVFIIELTDIAFAIDSILAAIALTPKFWLVFTGGVLGLILMRFAASMFLVLLKKFPRLEDTAYILVFVIGTKIILEALQIPGIDFHSASAPSFWLFWGTMLLGIASGFIPKHKKKKK